MPASTPPILVVEDHPPLGRFIAAALTTAGWAVVGPIADHASALEVARREPLAMAVIDRMLAGKDTLAIADALAERAIPCLMMSGYPRSTLPERFRDGPFLEKPFSMETLIEVVRALLGGGGAPPPAG